MLERYFVRPETVDRIRASWIASAIEQYVTWLAEHGYSATCVEYRVPLLVRFGAFARGRGARTVSALPRHVDAFVADWLRERCSAHRKDPRNPGREVSGPIEQMLRIVLPKSVGDRRSRQKPEPFRRRVPGFFAYLRDERGLREATVHHYMFYLRAFESYLDSIKLRRLRDLSSPILSAFVAQRAASLGKCGVRDSCGTLRVFLRYLYRERTISRDLSATIERPRSYRLSAIPRSITWEDVRRVLTCIDRRSSTGRRDYAMLLLLVTYGLRAREVAALTLDDIDWRSERVMIPGRKAGHSTAYPCLLSSATRCSSMFAEAALRRRIGTSSSEPWRRLCRSLTLLCRAVQHVIFERQEYPSHALALTHCAIRARSDSWMPTSR
jgi:integrase/recombinase XerD